MLKKNKGSSNLGENKKNRYSKYSMVLKFIKVLNKLRNLLVAIHVKNKKTTILLIIIYGLG